MISATFSLVQQLTGLHAMPALKIIHTADDVKGQVFVPAVNVLCAIGTIGLSEFLLRAVLVRSSPLSQLWDLAPTQGSPTPMVSQYRR